MRKAKQQRNSTSRKDPLLPIDNTGFKENTRCGACGRFILLLLPIAACACVLSSLYLLVYRLDVPITDATISMCLADYSPKLDILILISIGATLMSIVSAMRNVQINVYHRRQKSESKMMQIINLIAALSNTFAYVGFVVLALFDVNQPDPAPQIHFIGAGVFFVLSGLYGLLHFFLLFKQTHYPMFSKIVFALVPIAEIGCILWFIFDREERYAFEWFSVAFAALNVGLMSILFLVDPVDDELRDFFCCRRVSRHQNHNGQSNPPKLANMV